MDRVGTVSEKEISTNSLSNENSRSDFGENALRRLLLGDTHHTGNEDLRAYVEAPESSFLSSSSLPEIASSLAHRLNELGEQLYNMGQFRGACKCSDLAGDDVSLFIALVAAHKYSQENNRSTKDIEAVLTELSTDTPHVIVRTTCKRYLFQTNKNKKDGKEKDGNVGLSGLDGLDGLDEEDMLALSKWKALQQRDANLVVYQRRQALLVGVENIPNISMAESNTSIEKRNRNSVLKHSKEKTTSLLPIGTSLNAWLGYVNNGNATNGKDAFGEGNFAKGEEEGKGKAKGQAAKGGASNQSPTTDHPRPAPLRQVRVRRDALSVRPHLLVCVVHIVWDPSVGGATRDGGDDSDNDDDNDDDESWGDDGSDGDASGGKGAVGGLRGFGNDDSSDTDSSDDSDEHAAAASGGAAKKGTANTPKKNAPPFVFSQGASVDAGAFEAHVGIIEMRALSGVKNAGAVGGGAGGGDEGPGGGGGGAGTLSNQDEDPARTAAVAAVARMAGFISAQTRIHGNRKSGALGSHNASEVTFPLRYNAEPHEDVVFSPLSVGWKQEKGVYTASEFAHASLRDSGLGRPAKALLALPLCPVLRDASERVMSVAPLSNGYATRTTADARGGIVLECSSSEGEAPCRDMLLALVLEMITMAEGDPSSDSPTSGLHVLIEPVQIVADWDNALQFACFPSRDELLALPPLP